jgi:hypothetical protein
MAVPAQRPQLIDDPQNSAGTVQLGTVAARRSTTFVIIVGSAVQLGLIVRSLETLRLSAYVLTALTLLEYAL